MLRSALIYNHRSFFVSNYLNHVKFIFIWLAMTNKMAAKDLFYAQGLPSYGDSKHAKSKRMRKRSSFPLYGWFMVNRFFQIQQRMVPFSAGTNGEKNGSESFYYFFYNGIIINSICLACVRAT